MTTTHLPSTRITSERRSHRRTCILAGGLSFIGATLALLVHPWFALAAALGGVWLISTPDSKCDRVQ